MLLREGLGSLALTMIIALPLPLPGAAAELQRPEMAVARVEAGPARIDWLPQVDYERLVLTVSGPGDLFLRQEFEAGKPVFLSSVDSTGDRLPDGSYVWEVRTVPRTDKLPQPPLVLSGHFVIKDGSFIAKPRSNPRNAPESSLSRIPTKDLIENGDLIVKGQACIGGSCTDSDANVDVLRLKATHPSILFDEIGVLSIVSGASLDWAVLINPSDVDQFSIASSDGTSSLTPFTLTGGAPDNSLFVASNGNLGLGTATPAVHLDVKASTAEQATERLQNSSATGYSGTEYLDNAGNVDLFFGIDNAASTTRLNSANNNPIVVLTNSTERMRVTSAGNVGIGTASPANHLHVAGSAGTNRALIEETNGTTAPREMLEIRNNGGSILIYEDTSVSQRWASGTFGANFVLDEQSRAGVEYTFGNTGNLTIAGFLTQGSSRDLKTDFTSLDPKDVLARVSALPVSLWSYKTENAVRHIGPMAEDFHQAFGLGEDDKHIAPGDQAGVALVAVQGLHQLLQNKGQEIATLQRENTDLAKRVEALEAMLSKVMSTKAASDEQTP